jgi:DHA2 family multidrug resistance protein-like MFS transporter
MTDSKTAEPASSPSPADGLPAGQRLAALLAVLMAVSMATLDTAISNTALPSIAADLHTDAASSIWVVSAYQLAIVAALLPFASLGDVLGQRRVYLGGVVVFTLASLICGQAWSLPSLAVARFVQGLGAAAIVSMNLALIRHIYPAALLGRGAGYNALAVAISFTVGPTVASLILSVTSWHWLFLVNVPLGIVALVLGVRTLPVTSRNGQRFDYTAALLSVGMFSAFIFGIDAMGQGGDLRVVAAEWVFAAVCCALLLRRQRGHVAPMLASDLFRIPVFALSAATSVCSFAAQGLAFVALPFLFQHNLGRSQVEAGFLMTPWPAIVAIMAPIAGRLADRYSTALLGAVGLAALACGMAALALLPPEPSVFDLGWRLVLCGAGFGFFQTPNLRALMGSAPRRRAGGASGVVAIARTTGQATGAALVALCFALSVERGPALALWLGCGFAVLASVASLLRTLVPKPM